MSRPDNRSRMNVTAWVVLAFFTGAGLALWGLMDLIARAAPGGWPL